MGHMERECRRKQYDRRNKDKRFNAQAQSASISNEDENPSFIQAFMSKVQTNKIQLECFSFLLRIKLNFPCVGRDVSVLKCAKTMCHRILICTQALRCEAGRWGTSNEFP